MPTILLAGDYAQNLSLFLSDGSIQQLRDGLPATAFQIEPFRQIAQCADALADTVCLPPGIVLALRLKVFDRASKPLGRFCLFLFRIVVIMLFSEPAGEDGG